MQWNKETKDLHLEERTHIENLEHYNQQNSQVLDKILQFHINYA